MNHHYDCSFDKHRFHCQKERNTRKNHKISWQKARLFPYIPVLEYSEASDVPAYICHRGHEEPLEKPF